MKVDYKAFSLLTFLSVLGNEPKNKNSCVRVMNACESISAENHKVCIVFCADVVPLEIIYS